MVDEYFLWDVLYPKAYITSKSPTEKFCNSSNSERTAQTHNLNILRFFSLSTNVCLEETVQPCGWITKLIFSANTINSYCLLLQMASKRYMVNSVHRSVAQ